MFLELVDRPRIKKEFEEKQKLIETIQRGAAIDAARGLITKDKLGRTPKLMISGTTIGKEAFVRMALAS